MANGRPWFVFYDPAAVGIAHFGTFMVPFQPGNEAEELTLQATPFNYKEFPTKAAANTWINSAEGKKIKQEMGKTPGGVGNTITGGAGVGSILGLPALHNLRDLMVRVMKVVIGGAMIIIGLVEIAKPGQVLSKLPVPVPF